jgi:hypothetical protein
MLYSHAIHSACSIADRRARYRARSRRHAADREVPTARAEERVRQRDAGARWARIVALNAQLSAALENDGLEIWLALERALHAYWLEVALDHYALGYDAGRAQAWLDAALARDAASHDKLRALAAALLEIVAALEARKPE